MRSKLKCLKDLSIFRGWGVLLKLKKGFADKKLKKTE